MEPQTILVVDDDPDVLETIRFGLEREGYHVVTAIDGVDALMAVRRDTPDLMVLDVMIPKENGYRVSKLIKEDQAAGRLPKPLPIILLTARNLRDDPSREAMFRDFSQADAVMYKPFEMADLLRRIQSLLSPAS